MIPPRAIQIPMRLVKEKGVNNMLRFTAVIILFLSIFITCAAAEPAKYTLDDLYQSALNHSDAVKLAKEAVYVAAQDKKRALSVLIPRFSAFGEYKYYTEEKYLGDTPVQPEWSSTYGLRLDQSFTLNGKELIALQISKDTIIKNRFDLASQRERLLIQVAEAYYDVLKTEKAVDIASANVKRLETYKNAVQTQLKLGTVTKTDLYRASAELSGAQSDRIRAKNLNRLARSALDQITGIPGKYQLDSPALAFDEKGELDQGDLKQRAYENRADLNALKTAKVLAENEVRFTKSAWWPRVGVEGVYARPDASPNDLAPVDESLWAGVNLQFSLFDGGLRKAELNQSRSRERQAGLAISALKKQIALEVDQAYLNYITQKNTITALTDQLTFAKENHEAVTKQFDFGLADSIDVVDANTLLVTAERKLAEAVFDGRLALLTIEQRTGNLLKEVENRLNLPIEERAPDPMGVPKGSKRSKN